MQSPTGRATNLIAAGHHQATLITSAIITGIQLHLPCIGIVDADTRLPLRIELERNGCRTRLAGAEHIAVKRHLAVVRIGARIDVTAPELDALGLTGEPRYTLLGRVALLDRLDRHRLWLVGVGIRHIKHKTTIGKGQGAAGFTQGTASCPAECLAQGLG